MAFSSWHDIRPITWREVEAERRGRIDAWQGKRGDLDLEIIWNEIERRGGPRLVLDLRSITNEDVLVPSEYFSLGPALQRKLTAAEEGKQVLYRLLYQLGDDGVAEQFSIQFERQSSAARRERELRAAAASRSGSGRAGSIRDRDAIPQQPILGLAELGGKLRWLGALPGYLEGTFNVLAEGGEVTANDLAERLGMPEKRASDYLGDLHRLRLALREQETREGGGRFFHYSLGL